MRAVTAIFAGLMLIATPAEAQDAASAKAFVTSLYTAYYGDADPNYLGPKAKQVFSPRLLALIRRDTRLAHGEVGALDSDPICDCQDAGSLKLKSLDVATKVQGRAAATVALDFGGGDVIHQTLDLISTNRGWRVDDTHTKDTPSLAAYLKKHAGGR